MLCGGLNQIIFLFCRFLLFDIFIFAEYLSLCLYTDFCKASWYWVTESLKISYDEDNDECRDLIEIGSFLIIDRP